MSDKKNDPVFDFSKLAFNFGNQGGGAPFDFQATPGLLNAISSHLGDLVGQSSGYLESLPAPVRKRVRALKKLQEKHMAIDNEFEEEIRQLELKYHQRHTPLWQKRAAIIAGLEEPTEEEAGPEEEGEAPKIEEVADEGKETDAASIKGIPDFWLTALQNNQYFDSVITEKDIEALKHLEDVGFEYLPDEPWSFILTFKFANDNPFLEANVMKKTYHIKKQESGEPICETVESTELLWKEGKDLLQGCKGGLGSEKGSFFYFFTPPEIKEGSKPSPKVLDRMNMDFTMAVELKDRIIPGAIRWWTGEAVDEEDAFGLGDDDDDEDDGEGEEDEEYNSEGDEDWSPPTGAGAGQDAPAPECKQQ